MLIYWLLPKSLPIKLVLVRIETIIDNFVLSLQICIYFILNKLVWQKTKICKRLKCILSNNYIIVISLADVKHQISQDPFTFREYNINVHFELNS